MQKKKMSAVEENCGGDSKSNDVLVLKKVDIPLCETFSPLNLTTMHKESQSASNALASSQHRKVTVRISVTTSSVTTTSS